VFGRHPPIVPAMLSDRPYMRGDYAREKTSTLTWLICSIIAGFMLQSAAGAAWAGGGVAFDELFSLSIQGLRAGRLWTVVTHSFLHDTRYIFHGLGSVVMLYLLGRELLPVLGTRRFLGLYFGATVAGALMWTLVHWRLGGAHVGAMAAANALLIVFACFYPNRQMNFLLLFILPVSVKPKHLAVAALGLAVFGLFFFELRGVEQPLGRFVVSSSAHLGGILAGWVYFRFVHEARWRRPARTADAMKPGLPARAAVKSPAAADSREAVESPKDLRVKVDRVLDKINSHGFGSLTPDEKRLLDEARDLLSRR